jgi:hypothetical protein
MGTGVQKFEELQEFKEESVSDRQPWSVAFPRPRDEAKGIGDSPESHVRRFVHSPIPGTGDLAASAGLTHQIAAVWGSEPLQPRGHDLPSEQQLKQNSNNPLLRARKRFAR